MRTDVLVIGGGLSGLGAALACARTGAATTVLATGMGVLYLSSGAIHVMAYPNGQGDSPVASPIDAIGQLRKQSLRHPYAFIDDEKIAAVLSEFKAVCDRQGYPMVGDETANRLCPTALGTANPAAVVQKSMAAGDLRKSAPMTLVGMAGFRDFFVELAARELGRAFDLEVGSVQFDPAPFLNGVPISTMGLGWATEKPEFISALGKFIDENVPKNHRVGIPAILSVDNTGEVHTELESACGREVFEMPMLPPSLPGRRIYQALRREIFELGGQILTGCTALSPVVENKTVKEMEYRSGGAKTSIKVGAVVLATGSYFSGGLVCKKETIVEPLFHLPVQDVPEVHGRFAKDFLAQSGHPIGKTGIRFDERFMPCDESGAPIYKNLFACGDLLGGFDSLLERSGGGIALCSASVAGANGAKAAGR